MNKTLSVLSFDGGGIRGFISSVFIKLFCQLWGVNSAELYKYFGVIGGTSTGAMQATAYAYGGITAEQIMQLYKDKGAIIFNSILGGRASWITKAIVMTTEYPISTFYPNTGLIETITSVLPTQTLQDMKTNVMITSYNKDADVPVFFSNLNQNGFIGQNELASDVILASTSAPLYFPAANFSSTSALAGINFIDGGVQQNNPSSIALTLNQIINPTATRYCVLSVGTGLGDIGTPVVTQSMIDNEVLKLSKITPASKDSLNNFVVTPNLFSNMQLLLKLIDVGITGCQEAVHFNFDLISKYTLQNVYYYRFNYQLDKTMDIELDNTDPVFFEYMEESATQHFNDDIENISTFLGHLTA